MVVGPDHHELWGLGVCVSEAVGVVGSGAHVDFRRIAHQMFVVNTFRALAGSDIGKDFGQAAVRSDVDERRTGGVVFAAADRDGRGIAC